jgi:hypothetical protein
MKEEEWLRKILNQKVYKSLKMAFPKSSNRKTGGFFFAIHQEISSNPNLNPKPS